MTAWRGARGPGRSHARDLAPDGSELDRQGKTRDRALNRDAQPAAALVGAAIDPLELIISGEAKPAGPGTVSRAQPQLDAERCRAPTSEIGSGHIGRPQGNVGSRRERIGRPHAEGCRTERLG